MSRLVAGRNRRSAAGGHRSSRRGRGRLWLPTSEVPAHVRKHVRPRGQLGQAHQSDSARLDRSAELGITVRPWTIDLYLFSFSVGPRTVRRNGTMSGRVGRRRGEVGAVLLATRSSGELGAVAVAIGAPCGRYALWAYPLELASCASVAGAFARFSRHSFYLPRSRDPLRRRARSPLGSPTKSSGSSTRISPSPADTFGRRTFSRTRPGFST